MFSTSSSYFFFGACELFGRKGVSSDAFAARRSRCLARVSARVETKTAPDDPRCQEVVLLRVVQKRKKPTTADADDSTSQCYSSVPHELT